MNVWQRFLQRQAHRQGRKLDKIEEQNLRQQWFLLAGESVQGVYPEPQYLNPIYPPSNRFWADPFLWSKEGRYFIFFEDFPFSTWRGFISVIEIDQYGRQISDSKPVIEESYHLSYPFLFEHHNELYMMPEKCSQNRVDIYRCIEFPYRWVLDKTLISGYKIVDSTLLQYQNKWWLLAAMKHGRVRINESLFAFYAESPISDTWTPHESNPLVRDLCGGRPAGRIIQDSEGRLLRPSQNCLRRYGHGLNLNSISTLTTTAYSEEVVWQKTATDINPQWRAMHHLDYHQGMIVMDAQRLLPLAETLD